MFKMKFVFLHMSFEHVYPTRVDYTYVYIRRAVLLGLVRTVKVF